MPLTRMVPDVDTPSGKSKGSGPVKGIQRYTAPATGVMPPVVRDPFGVTTPATSQDTGGSGGDSGAVTQAATQRPSLDDFIKSNFLYTQTDNENKRKLDDFDAETLRLQQETEAEQMQRRNSLQRDLQDAAIASSEGLAGRGLLRSGFAFQNQDRINAMGAEKENDIASMLTQLISSRQGNRRQVEASNRDALNQQIQKLTEQFNSSQQIG